MLTGGADALDTYTGFAVVLFAGIAVAALFVLRQREPDAPRPFRASGYPVAPAIFVIASLAIVLNALWADLVVPMQTGAPWGRRPRACSSSPWASRSISSSAAAQRRVMKRRPAPP